jgi:hypothetical protein
MENLFSQYAAHIRDIKLDQVLTSKMIPTKFLLDSSGDLTSHYIPFDYINTKAKVVLVGITPGFTQWKNAVGEAQKKILSGSSLDETLVAAKITGAFSGAMRPNLVALLDSIGVQNWLKISSCETLFGRHSELVQSTSILRHPIFVRGENYNGTPSMVKTPFLQRQILDHFSQEISQLKNPLFIPLGPKVSEGLAWLVKEGIIKEDRVLNGLPHPSGANAERIAYFLGRKHRDALSSKTNAEQLDAARKTLLYRMQMLVD